MDFHFFTPNEAEKSDQFNKKYTGEGIQVCFHNSLQHMLPTMSGS